MLVHLIETAKHLLDDINIINITKDEYFTYLTPEGDLYDKSVLPE